MWESKLKCGLLCKNKIVTVFLLVFYTSKRYLLKKQASYLKEIGVIMRVGFIREPFCESGVESLGSIGHGDDQLGTIH